MDKEALLGAYDRQLRTESEMVGARSVRRLGPLWMATFPGNRGFVTYGGLEGIGPGEIRGLVEGSIDAFRADPSITVIEWKTRAHDRAAGLHEALVGCGFHPEEPESIMIGEAAALAVEAPLPPGIGLRRIESEADIRAIGEMERRVLGADSYEDRTEELTGRLAHDGGLELWVAEAAGDIVSAGRLEFVAGTAFAGLWGGATLEPWRGRGIYRALTSARAHSALARGARFLYADSTESSRPILQRSGLVRVSTTTPYLWRRAG